MKVADADEVGYTELASEILAQVLPYPFLIAKQKPARPALLRARGIVVSPQHLDAEHGEQCIDIEFVDAIAAR
ncbi:hypothetical protein JYP49_12615 [Nitratireductor aquimarinus]|uniref:hypothetical protein n=1 Tax=Nitratireductor TaxID=245876 RepID=UPI0019D39AA4|nr:MULTISPECIES: hypothetical protein [Nitratireductor]MBN7775422.1 hypothetical protein [Nitratireductor pacificus]MBN7781436.1 hypothetical protein [Nitratireductor pacificus]MBN7790242.1 hypothetical protein [Nitratireductor aquimarinus]MBY6097809.1 hypothetical protein [Nitratireductor aquimarinus]MCA1260566.1 hypothetical protein [Nitratireductor aquimarinus]